MHRAATAIEIFGNGFGGALVCQRALYSLVIFDDWYCWIPLWLIQLLRLWLWHRMQKLELVWMLMEACVAGASVCIHLLEVDTDAAVAAYDVLLKFLLVVLV